MWILIVSLEQQLNHNIHHIVTILPFSMMTANYFAQKYDVHDVSVQLGPYVQNLEENLAVKWL